MISMRWIMRSTQVVRSFLKESIQGFKEIDFSRIKTDHVATTLVPQYLKDTVIALR